MQLQCHSPGTIAVTVGTFIGGGMVLKAAHHTAQCRKGGSILPLARIPADRLPYDPFQDLASRSHGILRGVTGSWWLKSGFGPTHQLARPVRPERGQR